jgi:hypothetical protein
VQDLDASNASGDGGAVKDEKFAPPRDGESVNVWRARRTRERVRAT